MLYVVGRQGSGNGLTEDSAIFRIEYTGSTAGWSDAVAHVADACFTGGVYSGGDGSSPLYAWENPFGRAACMVAAGPCTGQPDGATCAAADGCHGAGTCQGGACVGGAAVPDGTACSDGDPCDGLETCQAGACTTTAPPLGLRVQSFRLARGKAPTSGTLLLRGAIKPSAAIAPGTTDPVTVEVRGDAGALFSTTLGHPASDRGWKRRGDAWLYRNGHGGGLASVALKGRKGGDVQVEIVGRKLALGTATGRLSPRLMVGAQCFTASSAARCSGKHGALRCR